MRFVGRHGEEILSLDDWARLGKPAAEHHWVPGRSAHELAAAWRCRDAEQQVVELVTEPISIRGDGKWMPDLLPVSLAKLTTSVG